MRRVPLAISFPSPWLLPRPASHHPDGDEDVRESRTALGEDTEAAPEPEPEKQGFWSRAMDVVQTGLDIAGFVPGLGAIPDLANAGISLKPLAKYLEAKQPEKLLSIREFRN